MTPGVTQGLDSPVPEADAVNARKITRRQQLEDWPVHAHRPTIGVPRLGADAPPGPNPMRSSITAAPRGDLVPRHRPPRPNPWAGLESSVRRLLAGSTRPNRRRGSWPARVGDCGRRPRRWPGAGRCARAIGPRPLGVEGARRRRHEQSAGALAPFFLPQTIGLASDIDDRGVMEEAI